MQMVVSFHGLIMKINSKVIFVAVVVIILIGIFLTLDDSYKIAKVIDGATIELDNGTQVRLIGIDNTELEFFSIHFLSLFDKVSVSITKLNTT